MRGLVIVGGILILFVSQSLAVSVSWSPVASHSAFLLESENFNNRGGVDHNWGGVAMTHPGQRDLPGFRAEMLTPGRLGGGISWDSLPDSTVIANTTGIALDITGLPYSANVTVKTPGDPLRTCAMFAPGWRSPLSGGALVGTNASSVINDGALDSKDSATFDFTSPDGLNLHGFAIVLVDSGWNGGRATLTFYDRNDVVLAHFGSASGINFYDWDTDDNFIGFWSATPISRVHLQTDSSVFYGRFDDIGLVYETTVVPEPLTIICAACSLAGVGAYLRRRMQKTTL